MAEALLKRVAKGELAALGCNISILMLKQGIETKELSAITGISVSLLNALKRGSGNPTLGTLITLANYFNVTINELLNLQGVEHESIKIIPVYQTHDTHDIDHLHSKQSIYLKITNIQDDNLFAVTLNNSSMAPFFDKGSIFVVSTQSKYTDGDIVLVRINNESNVFRKVFITNNGSLFQYISLNSEPQLYDNYHIIGKVITVIHEFGIENE